MPPQTQLYSLNSIKVDSPQITSYTLVLKQYTINRMKQIMSPLLTLDVAHIITTNKN